MNLTYGLHNGGGASLSNPLYDIKIHKRNECILIMHLFRFFVRICMKNRNKTILNIRTMIESN